MPLWIGPHDVADLLDEDALIRGMRLGFRELTTTLPAPQRFHSALAGIPQMTDQAEVMVLAPGALPSVPAFTVKVHAKYPNNPLQGRPGIQGVIHLLDAETGELLALIDSPPLTAHRTAAAGAVGADVLARPEAHSVAVVGAGAQGEMQFAYLTRVRRIEQVWVYDREPQAARFYAERRRAAGYHCDAVASVAEAVRYADIIVTATWSRRPFLTASMVSDDYDIGAGLPRQGGSGHRSVRRGPHCL